MSRPSSAPPTVVVIDDSRAELLAMEGLLRPLGYDLLLADNAEDGLRHDGLETIDVRSSSDAGTTFVSRWPRMHTPAP